jgi:hypothetical protein
MTLILSGTNGLSDVDGTAATPAIRGTDTNTGIFFPAADTIGFAEGGAEVARFDSSGNLGIGTSSPTNKLSFGANIGRYFALYEGTAGADLYGIGTETSALTFKTAAAERMRIDSSGNLLVGTTNANFSISSQTMAGAGFSNSGYLTIGRTDYCVALQRNGTNGVIQYFFRGNNEVGSISVTTTATTYTTTSDYRLKEAVQPMTGALARVQALKPVTYKWKADGSDGEGFIAHELQAVCPDAVTGQKDALDADGKPKYQGIDTSFLVATLTAAIQELKAIVDAQAVEIAALKGTA